MNFNRLRLNINVKSIKNFGRSIDFFIPAQFTIASCLLVLLRTVAFAQSCPSGGNDVTVTGSTAKLPPAPAGSEWRPNGGNTATIDNQGNISGMTAPGTYSFLLVTAGTTCGSSSQLTEKIYTDYNSAAFGGQFTTETAGGSTFPVMSFGTLADTGPNAEPSLYGANSPNTVIFSMADRTIHYGSASNTYLSGTTYKMTVSYNPVADLLTYTINGQTLSFHPKATDSSWPTAGFMSATMLYLNSSATGQKVDVTNIKLNGNPISNNTMSAENSTPALVISGYDYYNGFNVTADVTFTFSTPPANGGELFFDYKFGQTAGCVSGDNGCVDEVIVTAVAPVCSLSATATAGLCATATNTYSASVAVTLTNAPAGTITISLPGSAPISQTISANTSSFTAVFAGLPSDGASHIATISLPGCGSTTASFTAPVSCSIAPVCSISAVVTPGLCDSATNTFTNVAVITLTNPTTGVLTVTDGPSSLTFATTALSSPTFTATFNGLNSDGANHTVIASLPGCSTTTTTYTAPASCSVASVCGLAVLVTPGLCDALTNSYVLSGTITATNVPTSGTLTITSGAFSPRTIALPAGNASGTFSYSGLVSNGQAYTVTASYSNSACSPVSQTYTAPASCSVAPVCSMSATASAGVCNPATNAYSTTVVVGMANAAAGTLTVSIPGTPPISQTMAANTTSFTAVFNGLSSDGASHTATISLPGCGTTTATFTAPASCSVAPVCSINAVATPGLCASATNTYTGVVRVTLTNPTVGVLTITDGPASLTFATTAVSSATFTATFNGLISDGTAHTVMASLPGCSTTTTTYTAPASCSVGPVCSLSATATPGLCASATNTYSVTAVVTVQNPASGATLTISNGTTSQPFTTTAGTSNTFTMVFNGLVSDGATHTITASLPGCGTTTTTYTAPASCSVAPVCSLTPTVTPGLCASATNTYSATAVVRLTNPPAGVLTVTNGPSSLTTTIASGLSSYTFTATFNGLVSDGSVHTVTASLPGCTAQPVTYTAPASCSIVPVCSLSAVVTAGQCASATNTYSATAMVTVTNSSSGGTLTVSNGPASITATIPAGGGVVTFPAVFNGLVSDGATHTITASLPGCSTINTTYTAPGSCTQPAGTQLSIDKSVDKSKAKVGDVLTYTLVLTNSGTATATHVVVRDSSTTGLRYVSNSATAPAGTTFTQGTPVSTWSIGSISAGQSLSLTFQAVADSSGILYNKATIPGDTATVCTSIPFVMCEGDSYAFTLTAPLGRSSYKWFKDNVEISGQSTNVLTVTAPGTYSLAVDNITGKCPDFSCCPFIVEEDSLPTFQAIAVPGTCTGSTVQANGQIVLSGFNPANTYQYSVGNSFNEAAPLSGSAQLIPSGGVIVSNLANPAVAQAYTIRVYNGSGCYTDVTVMLLPTVCGCPAEVCVPYVIQQTKRAKRIGDAR